MSKLERLKAAVDFLEFAVSEARKQDMVLGRDGEGFMYIAFAKDVRRIVREGANA